ncbi:MAG: hypothetical protein P8I27_02470 [Pirellulaceae bacterium]|nr:hypothetical protein [Pirellulaceae bacterium]
MNRPPHQLESFDKRVDLLGHCLVLGISIWLFGPVLTGSSEFGFGDAANLYQPLYQWTSERWLAGQVPLWCALDNWGAPVIADASTGIFYPGKLIFLIPFLPFPVLFGLYTLVHVYLAVYGARWCGIQTGLTHSAAWLVGISYGFGGCCLSQTSNTVFLVGAAWLPIALGWIIRYAERRKMRSLIAFALILCMMILSGDPQMAFHVLLIAGIGWWLLGAKQGSGWQIKERLKFTLIPLLGVALLSAALAAIQILPTLEWSQRSERSCPENDRSIYRALKTTPQPLPYSPWERPDPGTHQDAIYQFSQAPWTLVDLVWPNLLGAENAWSSRVLGADRIWNGSIYLGVITFLLAIAEIVARRFHPSNRFLMVVLIIFLFASFGWYGIGWLINEFNLMRGGNGTAHFLGEPTGGLYWLMEILLPGYYRFRYPAKLFVIAALCLCLLAGKAADRMLRQDFENQHVSPIARSMSINFVAVTGLTIFLAGLTALNQFFDYQIFPLVENRATTQIFGALLHTTIVLGMVAIAWNLRSRFQIARSNFIPAMLTLAAIEIVIATGWTVHSCPAIPADYTGTNGTYDSTWMRAPTIDIETNQIEQLAAQLLRDRKSLYPKHHLLAGKRIIGSFHSIQPADLSAILYRDDLLENAENFCVDGIVTSDLEYQKTASRSRAFFPEEIVRIPPLVEPSLNAIEKQTERVFELLAAPHAHPATLRVVVESPTDLMRDVPTEAAQGALIEQTVFAAERKVFQVATEQANLLVLADYYDRNWKAYRVEKDRQIELPTVRVNRVLTGIVVPAGMHTITYQYRPSQFYWGVGISFLAWGLLGVSWIWINRFHPNWV